MTSTTVLAYIPSPPQGVWHLGPLPIRAYALFIILGIIVGCWWGSRRWIARGGQEGEVLDVAVWAVPFGLIGGRIYHVMTDWSTYFGSNAEKTPIDALKVWEGGLGIWGAVAFGALGAWLGCRRHGIKLGPFGDAIAPAILLAQAIGRIGNYFNQELFGGTTTLPWGLEIFDRRNSYGQVGPNVIDGVSTGNVNSGLLPAVHPTFLYELLWNVLVVLVLIGLDRYLRIGHGRLFALYVAGYCLGRFGIELMRTDHATEILGVRINVFTAAIVFACAAAYFALAPKGRELGLTMYRPWRADELEHAGVVGYVDPFAEDDNEFDDGAATESFDAVESGGVGDAPTTQLTKVDAAESEPVENLDGDLTDTDPAESLAPVDDELIEEAGADDSDTASGDDTVGDEADGDETDGDETDGDDSVADAAAAVPVVAAADHDDDDDDDRIVSAKREIAASAATIFELIADPAQQPRWDGNGNLAHAADGQRIHKVGDVFETTITRGQVRRNHVVEFEENKLIAWLPSQPDDTPPGHLWRWELAAADDGHTIVTHTYDWTRLDDPKRLERARWTTEDKLRASIDRLAELVEGQLDGDSTGTSTAEVEEAGSAEVESTETESTETGTTETGSPQSDDIAEQAQTPNITPNIVKRADAGATDAKSESDDSPDAK
ncbi:prolipoprotein diacylglyceryl transferase [Gordonia effusa NBRC 100432]|uniref:Phosphatidylglycerol--prolipoprotein diacylglyceryl transferase n=1 Tax=Gordonia effusa NBRC 100432 TaxID=1077974 RepID=H0R1V1_9ACTN|nr:prolipoprotein diacylglyceryl transferase [Gordonia effusa]GAB19052.1 prolipoprotein diacylglyceryl transferase [Gordonia effusa NBRC 100432]